MKRLLSGLLITSSCIFTSASYAQVTADIITANVQQFLQTQHLPTLQQRYPDGQFAINVGRLDPRLKLAECNEPMQFKLHGARRDYGHLTVRARCEGEKPWTIYVSANVDVQTAVVVASRPLQRGDIVNASMVELQQRSLNGLGQHFYQTLGDVLGKQVIHSTSGQRVLRGNMLDEAMAIKRGDKVIIVARSDALAVKMNGTALADGQKGEQIRVRNNRSQRIIKAEVIDNGEVAVLL